MSVTPWPPLVAYALAHPCPTCRAEPGQPCNAPNKAARLARADRIRDELGMNRVRHDPLHRIHAARTDAGRRHYRRDVGNAPWSEDREPGRRYDTLGDAWMPAGSESP